MTSVVSFKQIKQASLYFDKVIPVSLRYITADETGIIFNFPEEIPNSAMVNILYGSDTPTDSQGQRISAVEHLVSEWDIFRKNISEYWQPSSTSSMEESYDDLNKAYLENRRHNDLGPIRAYFQEYARALGVRTTDILLPVDES